MVLATRGVTLDDEIVVAPLGNLGLEPINASIAVTKRVLPRSQPRRVSTTTLIAERLLA